MTYSPPGFLRRAAWALLGAAAMTCGWYGWGGPTASADQTGLSPATAPRGSAAPSARYMFEEQIRPGMKGYGLTVMRGGKIERFDVEVIDVMKNFTPGSNAILVRCSGLGLEHSGIVAGMSGSPVYLEGKMIGAIAFGWGNAKDPIAGVQPIRQMLDIPVNDAVPETGTVQTARASAGGRRWDATARSPLQIAGIKSAAWGPLVKSLGRDNGRALPVRGDWQSDPRAASLHPLASPLMVSGLSGDMLAFLKESLSPLGLTPVASGGGGTVGEGTQVGGVADLKPNELQLEPGAALAIPLLTGDMEMSAIGTVTEVSGRRVWAFGHAMLAEGPTELPIATGYIYSVMPSLVQSFKMGTSYRCDGILISDEQTGIVGQMGKKPHLVPIVLTVKNLDKSLNHTYRYQLAQHPRLTPEILSAALSQSLTAQRQLPKEFTARIKGQIKFAGLPNATLTVNSLGATHGFTLLDVLMPVAMLSDNPYQNLKLESVELETQIEPADRSAEIRSIMLKRNVVAPGDELVAMVELAPFRAPPRNVQVTLKVPEDAPDGHYELTIGSSTMAISQEEHYFPQRYAPEDIKGLFSAVQRVLAYSPDQLYARLAMNVQGAAEDGREFRNLPSSRIAMYASEKRTNATPLYRIVGSQVEAGGIVADGGESFAITVDRNAGKRFFNARHAGEAPGAVSLPHEENPHPLTRPQHEVGEPEPGVGD